MSLILQNVGKHITLTEEEQARFVSLSVPKTIKRKQFLLREGEVCKHSAFVVSGCLRAYTIDKNGFEHILHFAPPGWWVADMYSLVSQQAGNLFIEAVEDSEVLLLSKSRQDQLYTDIPQFERFFRILAENSLVTHRQRLLDNLSLPAQERYAIFCKRYPTLIQCLPQKYIAAYIGVTPEFFSKMRKELLRDS
jgi:CRP-like cAMP-binding protein